METQSTKVQNVLFNNRPHAFVWVSGKKLVKDDILKIVNIGQRVINKYKIKNRDKIFMGVCLGRYDIVFEFVHDSANVVSSCTSTIQMELRKRMKNKICSSLVIGNKVMKKEESQYEPSCFPVRAYTFIRMYHPLPKTNDRRVICSPVAGIINNYSSEAELYWNPSVYYLLLVTSGKKFDEVVKTVMTVRKKTAVIAESSTIIALSVGKDRKKELITPTEEESEKIYGIISSKLSKPVFDLEKKLENIKGCWSPLMDGNRVLNRLGGTDVFIGVCAKTLTEIVDSTLRLREEIDEVTYTGVVLLPLFKE